MKVHLWVSGRVQGVFYRRFTVDTAKKLGIKGWCRNRSDGRVEIVAEGEKKVIETFFNELMEGPEECKVTSIVEKEEKSDEKFNDFIRKETV